jgi:hypothetical protein
MEQKEIRIECPEGYKIDKEKSTLERIVFEKINLEDELPKTWEELTSISGFFINQHSQVYEAGTLRTHITNKNVIPTQELADAFLALMQLMTLRHRYNKGVEVDWTNRYMSKPCIVVENNIIKKATRYFTFAVLSFHDEKARDLFIENFKDLLQTAKPLL